MGTNCNKFKHKEKLFLLLRVVRPWHSLPREAVGPSLLAIYKPRGDMALCLQLRVTLLRARGLHCTIPWSPFPPLQPWVSMACAMALTTGRLMFT